MQQPEICARCGERLAEDGQMCFRRHCNYKIYVSNSEDEASSDEYEPKQSSNQNDSYDDIGDSGSDGFNPFRRNKRESKREDDDDENADSDSSSDVDLDSDGGSNDGIDLDGCLNLDGLGNGCVWSVLKFFFKILTFPFRVIFWIISLFDD